MSIQLSSIQILFLLGEFEHIYMYILLSIIHFVDSK